MVGGGRWVVGVSGGCWVVGVGWWWCGVRVVVVVVVVPPTTTATAPMMPAAAAPVDRPRLADTVVEMLATLARVGPPRPALLWRCWLWGRFVEVMPG